MVSGQDRFGVGFEVRWSPIGFEGWLWRQTSRLWWAQRDRMVTQEHFFGPMPLVVAPILAFKKNPSTQCFKQPTKYAWINDASIHHAKFEMKKKM
jgi:hypothetical protein